MVEMAERMLRNSRQWVPQKSFVDQWSNNLDSLCETNVRQVWWRFGSYILTHSWQPLFVAWYISLFLFCRKSIFHHENQKSFKWGKQWSFISSGIWRLCRSASSSTAIAVTQCYIPEDLNIQQYHCENLWYCRKHFSLMGNACDKPGVVVMDGAISALV